MYLKVHFLTLTSYKSTVDTFSVNPVIIKDRDLQRKLDN